MNKSDVILITALKSFSDPEIGTDIVVFYSENPYVKANNAQEHMYRAIKYSKRYCVYTITERFIKDNCLTQCMISPKGEILGHQCATHLNLTYRGIMNNDDNINIIKTPLGNFFLAVDTDIFHPEVGRIASKLGADIIIASRYMDLINDLPSRACMGSENTAVSNNIFVFDVTEEGGRLFTPDKQQCIRESKNPPKTNFDFEIDLNSKKTTLPIEINNKLFQKYLTNLER